MCVFQSHDKDGGHTIRYGIAENPVMHANFMPLSYTEPELLPIAVLHQFAGISDDSVFPAATLTLTQ